LKNDDLIIICYENNKEKQPILKHWEKESTNLAVWDMQPNM
jgi:hypothetical protein